MDVILASMAVLAIIYTVPFAFYAASSALGVLDVPAESSPQAFLLGILITKTGTAVAFVTLARLVSDAWSGGWLAYGLIWFMMFAASEMGDAISRRATWPEALVGVASEAVYAPASALAAFAILGLE